LWSRAKAAASKKFTKHSAYKMSWASRWYKSKGGGWRKKKKANESYDQLKDIIKEEIMKLWNH
jgi:hypothetical protein